MKMAKPKAKDVKMVKPKAKDVKMAKPKAKMAKARETKSKAKVGKNLITYEEVFLYLSSDCGYKKDASGIRKRSIRRFSRNIVLDGGVLYHVKNKESPKRQWVADKKVQQQILRSLHDSSTGGCHFGRDKTRDKIVKRYFWHGMYEDIDEYIKTCEICQKVQASY